MMDLEICVDSVESAVAAEAGGAQRIELCSALTEGGITPSAALIRAVRSRVRIDLYVMIRPRNGDFFYSENEVALMQADIEFAAQSDVDGVVFGLLAPDGNVDIKRTRTLVEFAHEGSAACFGKRLQVTFHRAIDMTPDIERSLDDVIKTGADRLLTSGAQPTALEGTRTIRKLLDAAGDRIRIMVAGGVRGQNVQELARLTGAREFHAALRSAVPSPMTFRKQSMHLGAPDRDEYSRTIVLAEDVRELREAMNAAEEQIAQKPGLAPAAV